MPTVLNYLFKAAAAMPDPEVAKGFAEAAAARNAPPELAGPPAPVAPPLATGDQDALKTLGWEPSAVGEGDAGFNAGPATLPWQSAPAAAPPPVPQPASAAPIPGLAPAAPQPAPADGTATWEAVKAQPSAASQAFRAQEDQLRGEETVAGARPSGNGWEAVGVRSGQPLWGRSTAPQAPAAPTGRPATVPPQMAGERALSDHQQTLRDYHSPEAAKATGADLDRTYRERSRQTSAVNSQLDTAQLRSLDISNPGAARQMRNLIKSRAGFSPNTDTFKARYGI